jgi:hypothetical protein
LVNVGAIFNEEPEKCKMFFKEFSLFFASGTPGVGRAFDGLDFVKVAAAKKVTARQSLDAAVKGETRLARCTCPG